MPFAEDFTPFLQVAEFSSLALCLDTGRDLRVIFDAGHQNALGGMFEASQPAALGATSDLQHLDHGSQLRIAEQNWQVVGVQPDGTGMTRLLLERAP